MILFLYCTTYIDVHTTLMNVSFVHWGRTDNQRPRKGLLKSYQWGGRGKPCVLQNRGILY